jgi:hypothetical protein
MEVAILTIRVWILQQYQKTKGGSPIEPNPGIAYRFGTTKRQSPILPDG